MKKLTLFMACLLAVTANLWAQDEPDFSAVCGSGQTLYYYIINDTSVAVAGVSNETSGDLVIPSKVTNNETSYTVTTIGYEGFSYCSGLTSVVIPNTVTNIGRWAFEECSGLTSVTLPNAITTLDNGVFSNCVQLASISIPETVTTIGEWAFDGAAFTSLVIPNSVISIGNGAFRNCPNLASVTLYNNLQSLGYEVFAYCPALYAFSIPASVTQIGADLLLGTGWEENEPYSVLYLGGWCLGYKEGEAPVGELIIQEGSKHIANRAFSDCDGITSVSFPNTLLSIGNLAFDGCSGITSLDLPNSILHIGYYAFEKASITTLTLPNSLLTIGHGAFYDCPNLATFNIPASVTSIGGFAFEETAWWETQSENEIVYKDNWCLGCYDNCPSGKVAIVPGTKGIAGDAFYDCKNIDTLILPNSLLYIGEETFYNCEKLVSVTFGNSVKTIGTYAFSECGLTEITLPNSVTTINEKVFASCPNVSKITIGSEVTFIDNAAFLTFSNLTSIVCYAVTPPTITESVFYYDGFEGYFSAYNVPLYVPEESVQAYKNHPIWGKFTNILAIGDEPDAIAETEVSNVQIFGSEKRLVINNAANATVDVFDVMGRSITKTQRLASDAETIAVPRSGIYVVRMGNTAKKVFVK